MSAQGIKPQGSRMKVVEEIIHDGRTFATLIAEEDFVRMDFQIDPNSVLHEFIGGIYIPVTDEDLKNVVLAAIQSDLDMAKEMMS
jgi:hypothetical protein